MAEAFKFGLMVRGTRAFGETAKPTEEEDSFTRTAIFMKESGRMIRLKGLESISTLMGVSMRATGEKTSSMVTARKSGLMGLRLRATI